MPVTEAQFKRIALSFPLAQEKSSYGNPAIAVGKKFFARYRKEDRSIVWIVGSMDERDHLLEIDPRTYFITDHYKDYPSVLVRVERLDAAMLRKMLERRWRAIAPKTLVKAVDGAAPKSSAAKARQAPKKTK
jgi:hypothetical protein